MPQMYCSLRGLSYSPYSSRVFWRSHVRRQMPPRPPTTREILVAKGGTMWARINRKFCLRLRLPRQFRDLLHAANLWHWTHGFTSLPKEGVLRIFFALKNPDDFGRVWSRELVLCRLLVVQIWWDRREVQVRLERVRSSIVWHFGEEIW
jgi:hypothetical protein